MGIWDSFTGRKTQEQPAQDAPMQDMAVTTSSQPQFEAQDVNSFFNTPGAFDPASLHPLAGLNQDTLDYLSLDDQALSELPGNRSALPSRGWSDDLCYGTGVTYLAGLTVGGAWGLAEGLNRLPASSPPKLRLNSALNAITRRGPFLGNSAGVIAMVYNGFNSFIGHYRGKHDAANSIAAGALSGMLFKSTKGIRPMMISGGLVAGTAGAWTLDDTFTRAFADILVASRVALHCSFSLVFPGAIWTALWSYTGATTTFCQSTISFSTMNRLQFSEHSSGVAASSSASASTSFPATAVTSIPSLDDTTESSQHEQPVDALEIFNDPFTGVPSTPCDVSRLFMLCQCEARPCPLSIPASLFFLYVYAPPWQEESRKFRKEIPRGARSFMLDCKDKQKLATYTRLYTEWLFSGGAPPSLAKLHRNADGSTSVSFSDKVRACIYVLRLYRQRGYPLVRSCKQIAAIFGQETSFLVNQESWHNVVIRTEPPEIPENVWDYAYPTLAIPRPPSPKEPRDPTTSVQNQHFRGLASLQSSEPSDIPNGWTLWTPVTVPNLQRVARQKAYLYQCSQNREYVHSVAAMPMRETGFYRAVYNGQRGGESTRLPSPDVLAGAENEVEAGASFNATGPAQDPRHQLIKRLSQTPHNTTPALDDLAATKRGVGRPRQSTAPAPTKATAKPTRIRLIAPRRPSTPEQAAAFEEYMENHSPTYTYDGEDNDEVFEQQMQESEDFPESSSSWSSGEASYQLSMTKMSMAKHELMTAGIDTDGIGMSDLAEERVLFNPKDWE
ncbi:unnamed protein product [Aureobasidium mustum]|uniref:Tim17-domain-containing protein n=1 Tax=Aureobasidium mustum TaxID=2773714 RepID=A0A9N8JDK0_9PEZI|nr:unnamed protein product [Aureobasidium mustum]